LLFYCHIALRTTFLFTYLTITSIFRSPVLFPFVVIIIATAHACLSYSLRTSRGTSWSESGSSSLRWHNWDIHDRPIGCSWYVNHHVWYSRVNHIDNGKFNCVQDIHVCFNVLNFRWWFIGTYYVVEERNTLPRRWLTEEERKPEIRWMCILKYKSKH